MAPQTMEIIFFTLQPSTIDEGRSLLANASWNNALSTLTQQSGVRAAYWGQTNESQDKVYLLIDWISTQHCLKFMQSAQFTTFRTNLDFIVSGAPRSLYVPIASHKHLQIFHAGATEIAIFSSYAATFIDKFANFSSIIECAHGCTGIVKAIATNEMSDGGKEIGRSEQFYVAIIGWLDVEAHRTAMETKSFEENVPLIEDCVQDITVYHAKLVMV